jgi:hypothetical protein
MAGSGNAGSAINSWNTVILKNNGNVGIGKDPQAKLDVDGLFKVDSAKITGNLSAGNGISKLSIGNACYSSLNWGTAYIGFNAVRNNTTGNWTCAGDNAHNGGGVIYANVDGNIYFASIPNTGGKDQALTDAQIKQNIKMQLTPEGVLRAKDVLVTTANWPDFVFENDYNLTPLSDVEQYIKQNNHLPDIPSA